MYIFHVHCRARTLFAGDANIFCKEIFRYKNMLILRRVHSTTENR